jgi:predicted DNA-binding transcriptional regulator YafY
MSVAVIPRYERLPMILNWLGEGRALMAVTLAWRLGVSVRTVYRDLNVLRAAGYRIDSSAGMGGGIMLRKPRREAA